MIEQMRTVAGADATRPAIAGDAVHGTMPRVVVAPADAAACAAVLHECSANGWSVEVAGERTTRNAGRPPETIDVLLSTRRMRGVTEYEPDDLTIGVAAGTSVAELRERVAQHRQRVPLDAADARASVGGVLARAAAGPMRRSWSTPRRQVLGLEVVTGDGRVLRVGGRVVKNVAGYDLDKLMVGSMGTLGVITAAHLRLLPLPQAHATSVTQGDDAPTLIALARALLAQPTPPAAIELMGRPWRLIARFEGGREAVAAALSDAAPLGLALPSDFAPEARDAPDTPGALDALDALARIEADAALVLRVGVLPDRIGEAITWLERAADHGTIAAHAGDGIVRLLLGEEEARGLNPEGFADLVESARRELRGTVIVERAHAALMRAVDPWGPIDPVVMRLTSDLKRQFDPAGILQRDRWIA